MMITIVTDKQGKLLKVLDDKAMPKNLKLGKGCSIKTINENQLEQYVKEKIEKPKTKSRLSLLEERVAVLEKKGVKLGGK